MEPMQSTFRSKKTNSEVKLGTSHYDNMKNVEARYEVLENVNVMEDFIVEC